MAVTHLNGKDEGTIVCCTKGKTLLSTTLLDEVTCKRCLKIINTPPVVEEPADQSDVDNLENKQELDTLEVPDEEETEDEETEE